MFDLSCIYENEQTAKHKIQFSFNCGNVCQIIPVMVTDMCWEQRKYMQDWEVAETDSLVLKICWSASLL